MTDTMLNLFRALDDAEFQMVTKNASASVPKTIVAEYLKSIRAALPQEDFFDAVRADPTMSAEDKAYWLAMEPAHRADQKENMNEELTDEQVENWRNVLLGMLGPYARIMPRKDIQAFRDKMKNAAQHVDGVDSPPQADVQVAK